ncbi:MAG: PAS domain S-box protein, partial [Gammaproteobacteria bacterium]|nr:PAS domain S-box protein [Gammaproteobacteria bacterium]
MHKELRDKIKQATESSAIDQPEFLELLRLIDRHYDQMEATITQSLTHTTPIEAIFDSVTEALLSVSESGIVCNCNKICSRYFGLTRDQLIGSKIEHIIPAIKGRRVSDFLEPFVPDIDAAHLNINGGRVDALRANGEAFIAEISASQLEAGGGRIFVISLRDVTDRNEAETALRENEERYRALVENAPEAIVVYDVDGGLLVDVNDKACTLFNLPRKRLLEIGPEEISPRMQPDGLPSFGVERGYIDRALAGEHPTFEWMHKDSNGREIPCEVRFSALPSGKKRLLRASITDIAERKRNETIAFAQNKILEMIAANKPTDRTLRAICRCVEKISDDLRAAVMQIDSRSNSLSVAQAPSLPHDFRLKLDFVDVETSGLTCASAAKTNEDRITADIAGDAGWAANMPAATTHGIAAAWSFPVIGAAGSVIGTLDVYVNNARAPGTDELDKLSRMARIAGIAIKRQIDESRLRNSEMRYRGLFENV